MTATGRLARAVRLRVALVLGLALAAALAARARAADYDARRGAVTDAKPAILENVGVDEVLGSAVPPGLAFRDAQGKAVTLGRYLGRGRPVVMTLVYHNCPMLCGLVLTGIARGMRENGLELGKDFDALTVSFDPRDDPATAAERQHGYLQAVGKPGAADAWAFLVGDEPPIRRLTDAVGFHYAYDAQSKQFAHPAVAVVLTPEGKVSRYLYGIEFAARDVRLALVEAGQGRVGTSFDRVLLTCYRYDPASRKYEPYALGFVRLGSIAVLLGLGGLIAVLVRREMKAKGKR